MAGRRRWHPTPASNQPLPVPPLGRTAGGAVGSPIRTDAAERRPWAFDYFAQVIMLPAPGPAPIQATLIGPGGAVVVPDEIPLGYRGEIRHCFPYVETVAGVVINVPLLPGCTSVVPSVPDLRWRIRANGNPIRGLSDIRNMVTSLWGVFSPMALGYLWPRDFLTVTVEYLDPAGVYAGGRIGIRLVGVVLPEEHR